MPDPTPTTTDAPWTSRQLLSWMREHFERRNLDAPRIVAEMLLAHVIGCDRLRLYMEADRPASPDERSQLRELVQRAAGHEPVHLIVGRASFFGREYLVDSCTLIPQPCTEALVEVVLNHIGQDRETFAGSIADIGTGTGCITIALATQLPQARFIATDISDEVLALARRNAAEASVADRIDFRLGATWTPICDDQFDVIVSNPPYIPDAHWPHDVQPAVRDHIAESALRGGEDGLDIIRPLIAQAPSHLIPSGLLALEIAGVLHDPVITLVESTPGLDLIDLLKDEDDQWRILRAKRCS